MTLMKNGAAAADTYTFVPDDAPLPDGAIIVSLARLKAEGETLFARHAPVGVKLTAGQTPQDIGGDLAKLAAVVLEFAKFRDGRVFSWARQLRTRLGFAGEIRVTGDYLYDQIAFLERVGVDAFELPPGISEDMFRRALGEITPVFQPSADACTPAARLRR